MAIFLINTITLIKLNPQNFILKRSRIVGRSIPSRSAAAYGTSSYKGVDARNPPRRADLPAVGRQEPRSERLVKDLSIPLRLCALARRKKKNRARKAAKAQSPPRRMRLCALPAAEGLARIKKKNRARKAGKAQSPPRRMRLCVLPAAEGLARR
jgi:hypothetical protein